MRELSSNRRFALVPLFLASAFLLADPALAVRSAALGRHATLANAPHNGTLERADGKPSRASVAFTTSTPLAATSHWGRLASDVGSGWRAVWDRATAVPGRLYGPGVLVSGSIKSAALAEIHARSFLARHVALLAPGAAASDFLLVSNQLDGDTRSIGFVQTYAGMRVIGGQLSFRYKNDRLFMIGSEALPNVSLVSPATGITRATARGFATSWMHTASRAPVPRDADGPFVLPLVGEDGVHGYRRVYRVRVDSKAPVGRWNVYVDAASGAPVARRQLLAFAEGSLLYNAPVRYPGSTREDFPAQNARIQVNGSAAATDPHGTVTFAGAAPVTVKTSTDGPLVTLDNRAGDDATAQFTLHPDGNVVWDLRQNEALDAQLSAFVHTGIAKDFARTLNPSLPWLDQPIPVNVNIDDSCNAFSDGNSINFFMANAQCANTARLADVVYHEFGHSLHTNSIIEGVGSFDGAHSEGLADFLASSITGDPGMGRGFFKSNGPLRHIDPPDREHRWPDDISGIHTTGLIFSGAMWDLRTMMIEKYGEEPGIELTNRLFYATLRRATSIPSTYLEVLAEDDDDGDLSNGTPNVCDINTAFGIHGLRTLDADVPELTTEPTSADGHEIQVTVSGLFAQCPGDTIADATIHWRKRGKGDSGGEVTMLINESAEAEVQGAIPEVADGTAVEYQVTVRFSDGTEKTFPDNPADPFYEFYVGDVVTLYCTDFETDPFEEGWTHNLESGADGEGADDWQWGVPTAVPASGDPGAAFSGTHIIGNDLGGGEFNGKYQANKVNVALGPAIEVGQYSDVHLQFFRWLTVEDGFFDKASVTANGETAWQNTDSNNGNASTLHHVDRQWRFQDVPVSKYVRNHVLEFGFRLESDQGLEYGGWNVDEVCVVALKSSICGDGVITGAELCDNGADNDDTEPDVCRTSCFTAWCGDGVLDSAEQCDDGNTENGDDCTSQCRIPGAGCGCGQARLGPESLGTVLLLSFVALCCVRRRRRSSAGTRRHPRAR